MPHLIVTVNKLNRRSSPIANVADKSNIIDTVSKGFSFDSIDETNNAAGTWYKDADSYYYWAGGLMADGVATATTNVTNTTNITTSPATALLKPPTTIPHDMPLSRTQCIDCSVWMKNNFQNKIIAAVENTPFDEQLVYAIAFQETAQRWQLWMNVADASTVLERCVFDASGDFPDTSRSAFPKNKNEFEAAYGSALTQMLIDEGNKMRAMPQPGAPHGFAAADYLYKGYGIFQYDLQNIKDDESFFRNKLWYSIDECLSRLLKELNAKWKAHPNDMYNTVKAYNGSGNRAEDYAQRVSQFYTWITA
ncbi:MAG TPA: hypothetical protein VHB70_00170 [Parafilimonas sp.]|nr:hypothetical protein [Parafilimonas sp.]